MSGIKQRRPLIGEEKAVLEKLKQSQTAESRLVERAQIRVLQAEGLRGYQEKTYFTERPDPQFAETRGP